MYFNINTVNEEEINYAAMELFIEAGNVQVFRAIVSFPIYEKKKIFRLYA